MIMGRLQLLDIIKMDENERREGINLTNLTMESNLFDEKKQNSCYGFLQKPQNIQNSWHFFNKTRGMENSQYCLKIFAEDYVLSLKSINTTAEHPYLVKLYSEEECKNYENDVWNKEYDGFNGGYCERGVSVSEISEGDYIAVQNLDKSNSLISSLVVNILTQSCSLKCGSLDQTGISSSNASAKKGTSVLCEINLPALSSKKDEAFFSSINSISNEASSKNLSLEILDLAQMVGEYLCNSSISSFGANSPISPFFSNLLVVEPDLNKENTTLVSTTNFIYDSLCLSEMACLNSLPSSKQSSSVNSDFAKSFSSFSNISSCFIFFKNASLANADQLSHEHLSILCLTSLGTDKVIDTILTSNTYYTFNNIYYVYKSLDSEKECKNYENDVWNKEYDRFNGEFCTRWVSVKQLEEGDKISITQNLSSISFGDNTSREDNSLSTLSPEKIGQSNFDANAKYCTSFKCLDNECLACSKQSSNCEAEIKVICPNMSSNVLSKMSLDNLDLLNISSLCFSNSVNKNSGATNSNLLNIELITNTSKESPVFSNEESTTLTSTTTSILDYSKYLCDKVELILLENSSASISVNLDLESPLFNCAISSNLDLINLPTKIDQSMLGTCLTNPNSFGILIIISSISSESNNKYLKLSNAGFYFDKIISIKQHPSQQVYDLAIENTHNFVANDIIAYNTYLGDSISDITAVAGNFSVNTSTLFVDAVSDRVGIGTTSPQNTLNVVGNTNVTGHCVAEDTLISVVEFSSQQNSGDSEAETGNLTSIENSNNDGDSKINNLNDSLNNEINKENKKVKNVASRAIQILADYDSRNITSYINFSVENNSVEGAPVALRVMHQPDELGLSGHLGSNPGRGASTPNNSEYRIRKVPVQDVKSRDYVLSLNESSGQIQPARVKELLDMGEKLIYELTTESGKSINTTAEHPYLVRLDSKEGYVLNANGEIINNLPSNSEDLTFLNNLDKSEKVVSLNGGLIFNTIIPKCSLGGNSLLLRKCLSNVNIIRDSDLAILDNCLSVEPNGALLTSYPCFISNLLTSSGKFSSERKFNLFLEENMLFFSNEFRGICHNREDSLSCERWKIILKNLIYADSCSEQFQNLPDHDPCSFKSRSSATDFTINNDMFINFNSHDSPNNNEYLKFSNNAGWFKVIDLEPGMEIAIQDDSLDNFSNNCFVEIETPISNNFDSYVQSGEFSDNDNATNSSSFVCSFNNCFACGIKDLYSSKDINSILFNINEDNNLNSFLDNFDLDRISFSFLRNSCLSFSGANNCNLSLKIISKISPEEINALKSTFASSTTFIYYNPLFNRSELIDDLTLFENSSASCSVNLDFDTMSLAIENCNSLIKESTTLVNAKLNSCLNSAGISNLIVISSMKKSSSGGYLNLSNCGKDVYFDKIVSIKQHPAQHVYDLAIENTHNFIANDIVAHNTYLGDSVSDVATDSGNFSADSSTLFVDAVSNRVGIGTTNPQNLLNVAGNTNVTGHCVAENSMISMADGSKKRITEIEEGDRVLSLDEKTGEIVSNGVKALLDMGEKPIYELTTESGKSINTTAEHPYLVKISTKDDISNLSSNNIINLPLKSSEFVSLSSLEKEDINNSGLSCGILNKTSENIFFLVNSIKSSSLVTNTLCSDLENAANLPLESPFGLKATSYFIEIKKFNNSFFTFSSKRNLSWDDDIVSASSDICCILQSCLNMFFCERSYECCNYFFNRNSCSEQFQNLPDHDPCSFESGLSMTDFTVNDNVIINFNSHDSSNNKEYLKFSNNAEWFKVIDLEEGMEIAVPDFEKNTIKWEKVASIKQYPAQHVYDLAIENNSLASITTSIHLNLLENLFDSASLTFFPKINASSCVNSLSFEKDSSILSCTIFFSNASLATSDQFITLNSDNSFQAWPFLGMHKLDEERQSVVVLGHA